MEKQRKIIFEPFLSGKKLPAKFGGYQFSDAVVQRQEDKYIGLLIQMLPYFLYRLKRDDIVS